MGKHDQDNTKDGQWPRPVPKDDIRDDPQNGSGKHNNDSGKKSNNPIEPDESNEPDKLDEDQK